MVNWLFICEKYFIVVIICCAPMIENQKSRYFHEFTEIRSLEVFSFESRFGDESRSFWYRLI